MGIFWGGGGLRLECLSHCTPFPSQRWQRLHIQSFPTTIPHNPEIGRVISTTNDVGIVTDGQVGGGLSEHLRKRICTITEKLDLCWGCRKENGGWGGGFARSKGFAQPKHGQQTFHGSGGDGKREKGGGCLEGVLRPKGSKRAQFFLV